MQKDITFCYIPSKQSPADYATRGGGSLFMKLLTAICGGMDRNG